MKNRTAKLGIFLYGFATAASEGGPCNLRLDRDGDIGDAGHTEDATVTLDVGE
jgi:hypothetical protein